MHSYISNFAVYTLAMTGVIFIAFVVAKKCMLMPQGKSKNNFLQVENYMSIEPGKGLYVVKAGRERFLIASSRETCQFMTKLEEHSRVSIPVHNSNNGADIPARYTDFPDDANKGINDKRTLQANDITKHFTGVF